MYQKTVLSNGVRIVTETMPHVHSVSAGIWLDVGSRDERGDERGATHFIEHMLFKGTNHRSALDIAKQLDALGGLANAFTTKEQLCLHAKVLDVRLPTVVDILTDLFANSTFAAEDMERERQVIAQEIHMTEDTPDDFVHILFQELFWKDDPLGWSILGTRESIAGLDRDRLLSYLARTLSPAKVVVAAAGKLDHQQFVDLLAPSMERLSSNASVHNRRTPENCYQIQVIPKDLEQVHICLGIEGCSQTDDHRFACQLLSVVLGGNMSSRLFQEVREKRGLAYVVFSFLNSHQDTGSFGVYSAVGPEQVTEAIRVIREQVSLLATGPIGEAELAAAKEHLIGSMYLNVENTDSRMHRLARNELLWGRLVPLQEVENRINEVTAEAILEWFRGVYGAGRLSAVVLGPARANPVEQAIIGTG